MKPKAFMLIAGEASGDLLAAELVAALRVAPESQANPFPPEFFGAGGSHMAKAGVELAFDLTQHSVIGISEVAKKYFEFRRMFNLLFQLAIECQPDVIIGVDYGGFNLRFARAIKNHIRKHRSEFNNWNPKIVQYVSPQVWASRAGRAYEMAETHDLLLSIFPFEKAWYAERVPKLRVEFVGRRLRRSFCCRAVGPMNCGGTCRCCWRR
jgi:lipid-A-disaccharide synthase